MKLHTVLGNFDRPTNQPTAADGQTGSQGNFTSNNSFYFFTSIPSKEDCESGSIVIIVRGIEVIFSVTATRLDVDPTDRVTGYGVNFGLGVVFGTTSLR